MSKIFNKALKNVSLETKNFIDKSFEVVDYLHEVLNKQGKTQKDLAMLLNKKESEISKWMSGNHNFTLKSITKIESVLNEKVIVTPKKRIKDIEVKFIPVYIRSSNEKKSKNSEKFHGEETNILNGLKSA